MPIDPQSLRHILFICVHNSARSQMAEAFATQFGKGILVAESAGLEPGVMNPLVVEAMAELGIDLAGKPTQSVFDLYTQGNTYDYVITVCDKEAEAKCPVFPGLARRLHWPFPDPSQLTGTHEKKLERVREIRDQIKVRVHDFVSECKYGTM